MSAVSEVIERKKKLEPQRSVGCESAWKKAVRAGGCEGTSVGYLCPVRRQNRARCLQYVLTVVVFSSTFAKYLISRDLFG